jgi:ubiquinone/menaquinone biosynthesis C-methylase UbiE
MLLPVLLIILALAISILFIIGSPRSQMPRQAGIEGIEDVEAARAYDLVSRMPPFILLRRLIIGNLSRRNPRGILADVGCGPGYLANLIADRFPDLRVIGVDASDEMVRTATLRADKKKLSDRVTFRRGDVARLPFEDGDLDFVLSTLSLHHWSNPAMAFREIHRVLKPEGRAMIFDLRRDARRRYYWLLRFVTSVVVPSALRRIQEPMGSLISSYAMEEVQSLLGASPFTEWRIEGGGMWMFAWMQKAT